MDRDWCGRAARPPGELPGWASACPPTKWMRDAHGVAGGGGPLGYICCDAINCLPWVVVERGRGCCQSEGRVGRRGRGALVRPELGPVPHRTGQPTGARVGRTRSLAAPANNGQGSAPHTRGHRPRRTAPPHRDHRADVKPAGPDCRWPRWSPTPPRCRGAYSSLAHPRPHWPTDQALMTLWRLPRPISILRGFAFSATGIRSRSTPPS